MKRIPGNSYWTIIKIFEMKEYDRFTKVFMNFVRMAEDMPEINRSIHFAEVKEQFLDHIEKGLK